MWSSWQEFWAMNGHGQYIWTAYGLFFAVVVVECWQLSVRRRKAVVAAKRAAARQAAATRSSANGSAAA